MSRRARTLLALVTALALVAGLASTATSASAEPLAAQPVAWADGSGINYGYASSWGAPEGTTDLAGYVVSLYAEADSGATNVLDTVLAPVTEMSVSFTGLTPGAGYFSTVAAVYGGGTTSVAVATPVAQAFAQIGKVRGLAVRVADRRLVVSWTAPKPTALTGPIFAFLVLSPGDPYGVPLPATQTSVTLTGLTNGRAYPTTVLAIAGDRGVEATVTGTPIGAPVKPTRLNRTWKPGGKAKLTWKPSRSTAAAPVTGYRVYVNGKLVKTVVGRTARTATLKGEKKRKKYAFAVRAYNPVAASHAASVRAKKRPIR